MQIEDFELLSKILKERSGLVITQDKSYLLETRLMPIARKHNLATLGDLCNRIRTEKPVELLEDITDAMTTNESLFFRDTKPFTQLKETVLPKLLEMRSASRHIRIWCAACSTGQEPYSLAMLLKEDAQKFAGWRIEIIASDISNEVLDKAKKGFYSQFEVQRGLPITLLMKYFKQIGDKWQLDNAIRSMVQFRHFNLLDPPAVLGRFDIVFCRNVLIYFDAPTKKRVLEAIARQMASDGTLFLGAAETVLGITEKFKRFDDKQGIYMLNN